MKRITTLLGLTLTLATSIGRADVTTDLRDLDDASLMQSTDMTQVLDESDANLMMDNEFSLGIEARPGDHRPGPGPGYPGRGPGYPPGPGRGPRPGPGYPPPPPPRGPGYPGPGRPYPPAMRFTDITCESYDYRPSTCTVWGAERVEILQQYSGGRGQCYAGRSFYVVNNGIQVTDGCRGLFRVYVR